MPESYVYEGKKPSRHGDMTVETQGMAPIPESERYGASWRNFTVWFASNLQMSSVFTGTLAVTLGLGFWPGLIAIVIGIVLGALPVAYLTTWGPKTGMGQLPFARLPFGKTIALPAAVQWLSTLAWDSLVGIFGGQAAQSLFHIPFYVGVIIVLALEGSVGFLGYEFIHQLQKWASLVLALLFILLSWKILQHGTFASHNAVSGGTAVGMFVLMTTIAFSGSFSWASYAADYSRYQPKDTNPRPIALWTLLALSLSYIWTYAIGAAGAKLLTDQTASGVRTLVGGGLIGVLALLAIILGTIASNSMNDYSGSLALQAGGIKIRRQWSALVGTVFAFFLILWLNHGNTSAKFQNILLFASYWIAPFLAVILVDWFFVRSTLSEGRLRALMDFSRLASGWSAAVSLVVGFLAMIPFMDTNLIVGALAKKLDGADISFYVGFVVAGIVYMVLRRVEKPAIPAADGSDTAAG
jgi:NCS1 family nucleobase:cation symporter-1